MEFRNIVKKIKSKALERITREAIIKIKKLKSRVFLSSLGRTFKYIV